MASERSNFAEVSPVWKVKPLGHRLLAQPELLPTRCLLQNRLSRTTTSNDENNPRKKLRTSTRRELSKTWERKCKSQNPASSTKRLRSIRTIEVSKVDGLIDSEAYSRLMNARYLKRHNLWRYVDTKSKPRLVGPDGNSLKVLGQPAGSSGWV